MDWIDWIALYKRVKEIDWGAVAQVYLPIVLAIVAFVGWLCRKCAQPSVSRRHIYRRVLAKQLQIRFFSIPTQWKIRSLINCEEVKTIIGHQNKTVLEKWILLRRKLAKADLPPLRISGKEFYESVRVMMPEKLEEEAKIIGEQILNAAQDPRFSESQIALQWMEEAEKFGASFPKYYEAVTDKLKLLNDAQKEDSWKSAEICIAAATVSFSRSNGSTTATVVIPDNPFVAWTKEQRKLLERDGEGQWPGRIDMDNYCRNGSSTMKAALMRFSAGGSLTILKVLKEYAVANDSGKQTKMFSDDDYTEFIVVGQKDSLAGIHPSHLVPSSGISENEEDWQDPLRVVVGECVEEIRIRSRDGDDWFYPKFNTSDAADLNQRVMTTMESHCRQLQIFEDDNVWKKQIPGRPRETVGEPKPCRAEVLSIGDDTVIINKKQMKDKHLLVLDSEFGAVDVMAAVRIQVPKPLSRLRVLDGEAILDRESEKMKLLWRNVFVFSPIELANVFSGQESKVAAFFGRDEGGNWRDGEPVTLSACPRINPPLWGAGPALLKKIYELEVQPFDTNRAVDPAVTFRHGTKI